MPYNQNASDERVFIVRDGHCKMGVCGSDAACREHRNNTYTCLCPHDSLPPTKDGRCPTRITVPLDPRKIENIMPPHMENSSVRTTTNNKLNRSMKSANSTSISVAATFTDANLWQIVILSSLGIFIILIILIIIYKRREHAKSHNNSNITLPCPVNLKDNLLQPERYAPNPHYSICAGVLHLRHENIAFKAEIGRGCFGTVYKGELLTDPNQDKPEVIAIKVLKESATREIEEDFMREVDITSAFRHKNILTLIGVVLRERGLNPMMVFEYMCHGDLAEVLRNQNKTDNDECLLITKKDLLSIALQIASGMDYLAAQRFVHRDLACRNCLVTDGPVVKIADFGMSRDVYTCDYYKIGGSRLLPVRWMSPESVVYGRFTLESDIWSYGVVLWEIYTFAKQPYYGHTNDEVVKLILQGIMLIPPDDCPMFICKLMESCWKTEPRDRIKFAEIYHTLNANYTNYLDDQSGKSHKTDAMKTLPRPPKHVVIPQSTVKDLLDPEGYLQPNIMNPVQYLELESVIDNNF